MLSEIMNPRWIAEKMEEGGYSDRTLAVQIGVTPKAVEHWRTGARRPDARNAEALLGAFGYVLEVRRV